MLTLADIENTTELDLKIIRAAAVLESRLRNRKNGDPNATLGALAQDVAEFQGSGFIRDLNFAIGVRNTVAHLTTPAAAESEKTRAAGYLTDAIRKLDGTPKKSLPNPRATNAYYRRQAKKQLRPSNYSLPNTPQPTNIESFSEAATAASLAKIRRSARNTTWIFAGLIWLATVIARQWTIARFGENPLIVYGTYAGLGLAGITFLRGFVPGSLSPTTYYRVVGARFANGDHRCIHCGNRGRDGRGIYTHGQYKSNTKFHECSKCKKLLFTS